VKILVLGVTGHTGYQVAAQALAQGHAVTALVRNAAALPITDERLRVVTGDTTRDQAAVAEAVRGQDVVVSALGRRNTFKSEHLIERSMRVVVPAMEAAGVRRLILVSAFGVGESHRDAPLLPRIIYRSLLRDIFADKRAGEDQVKRSGLDWTIVYPVLLTDGPLTGKYRAGERLALRGMPKISRADVAHFILTEAATGAFVRKTAALSY
jgi:putative NADH-flavin reductase